MATSDTEPDALYKAFEANTERLKRDPAYRTAMAAIFEAWRGALIKEAIGEKP
jgi:hypothetical protein